MSHQENPRSAEALLKFLDTCRAKGWVHPVTAAALRSSSSRVLASLDLAETRDVQTINVEDAIRRFRNLNPTMSPDSLRSYGTRLHGAIAMFLEWQQNPTGWRTKSAPKLRATSKPSDSPKKPTHRKASESDDLKPPATARVERVDSIGSGLTYPYPLRPEVTIAVSNVPRDLKASEVERLCAWLRALAIDYKP